MTETKDFVAAYNNMTFNSDIPEHKKKTFLNKYTIEAMKQKVKSGVGYFAVIIDSEGQIYEPFPSHDS